MKYGDVKSSTLATTTRWDAHYNLAVIEYLRTHDLDETPANVETAMAAIKHRNNVLDAKATKLRIRAKRLSEKARDLTMRKVT